MSAKPVTPTLNSIVICDHTLVERGTNKRSLIGIFQNIRAQSFPCTHASLHIYSSVTDAQGSYVFSVKLLRVSDGQTLWEARLPEITIADRLQIQEICLRLYRATFPTPGKYEFQLFANDELLALRPIYLEQAPQAPDASGAQPPVTPE